MHSFVDGLDHFLGDHHNEVVIGLALVVLAEAVIIWLWARRAGRLRRRLDAALEAAGSAATHAAAALAVDALRPAERELEAHAPAPVATPAATWQPRPSAAARPAPAPAEPLAPAPAWVAPPVAPAPVAAAPVAPVPVVPVVSVPAPAAPVAAPMPLAASASPVDTAAALRAAAVSEPAPAVAATGVAAWAVEAAAQIAPAPLEPAPAPGLGGVAAWTQTAPVGDTAQPWSWGTPAAADTATGPAPATSPTAGAPVRLLLVEDDVNVAKLYRMLLESRGYTVTHAADGVEGLDAARRERPDLILLDVMMPRMNGISFLQALREDSSLGAVPAVVLSNFREPRLVERAMALGALEYMVKAQTRPETLVGAIPHWLRGERVVTA
jgi:CheY-like chemotaxis protein